MSAIATPPAWVFKKITVRETIVLLALAWLIPFLVHLVPWPGARTLGAYLLPMFWATFVAVYFYGAGAGLLTALFAPAVNLLVTGQPAWSAFGAYSLELILFVLAATWAVRRWPGFWLLAPLGYLVAKTGAALLQWAAAGFAGAGLSANFFSHMLAGGAAGLIVLTLINGALVKLYPKPSGRVEA